MCYVEIEGLLQFGVVLDRPFWFRVRLWVADLRECRLPGLELDQLWAQANE